MFTLAGETEKTWLETSKPTFSLWYRCDFINFLALKFQGVEGELGFELAMLGTRDSFAMLHGLFFLWLCIGRRGQNSVC